MTKAMKIAIVDDEKDMRQSISQWLALSGYDTETFSSAEEALGALGPDYPGIVISDIRMPGMDGIQFLKKLMGSDSALPVIMITGHGDVPMAVEAMRIGAFDFLEKPFNPDRMSELAKKATNARRLTLDNRALRRELSDGGQLMRKLIGQSPAMERLREDVLDLGQADGHVLIDGETGTGKTLIAHALHAVGSRAGKKFVLISCAAMDQDALLQRLFGPMQPDDSRLPAIEEARGGTLVLEDIESLSDAAQARLLSVINDQGTPPETRIIAICNLQDEGRTCETALRPDLYYRLAALKITVPPLRQRGEDILTLFTRFSDQFSDEYGCDAPQVSAQEAAQLLQAPWPGNVRQLINLAERAVLQSRRGTGTIASLLMNDHEDMQPVMTTEGKPLKEYVEAFERMLIDNTMRRHKGSISAVMDELCLPRRTLNEKMAKYNLQRADYL
ncbi:sigma-54-dependent transcriptional regulator [Salipiger marinus]|jgi:DNA-binding NtrC family response regulator|uniref:DNA-binding transcriptional response regulator, NtrC family, contains REC, AAA-type ATPase, and a Fis-type DNA-binding domains n=1 Tax=Salipiger marinus TaxID=555512 RepID=A0A1G8TPB3_9RHOB|nr:MULTISPECIES: sigma-54 dependent transcriptional regulator [Salipiger]HBM58302.1 sigma-54-dependent Fis family transcriptional regulator [Citreicella sp.]MCD1619494.1 sigma-54 dependent transcriptional regulator [Salipiger manganoxidans]MEB3420328.1 sigma-54 dependent transcriptional regulator [Salipiger manganoxidans]SDJ43379.1 DNA-binding transcriptional response regulator, NtrC family, contains REC, AAA-type ATPase, and a Fis-type DNA-binding domains [Salipiger marinus]HBT00731.1 sigma-5